MSTMKRAQRRGQERRVKARWVRRLRLARRRQPWEEHEPWVMRFAHRWAQAHGFWCGHNLMATILRRCSNRRERREGRCALRREVALAEGNSEVLDPEDLEKEFEADRKYEVVR